MPPRGLLMVLGLLAAGVGAVLVLPAAGASRAAGILWHQELDGLYGDVVADVALTGNPPATGRWMLMLPAGNPLQRVRDDMAGWEPVLVDPDRPTAAVFVTAVARDDEEGQRVYAGLGGRTRFAASDDGGVTWAARVGPTALDRIDRLTTSAASGRVYAMQSDRSIFYTSDNRGQGWIQHVVPGQGGPVRQLFTSPDDAWVYMVDGDVLCRTLDNPDAWTPLLGPSATPPATATLTVQVAAVGLRGRLHAAGRSASGGYLVLSSDDRGQTWAGQGWPEEAAGVAPAALGAGETRPGLGAIWLGLQDGRVFESEDMSRTWREIARLPQPPTLIVADPFTEEVWVGSDGLGLYRVRPGDLLHTGAVSVEAMAVAATSVQTRTRVLLLARVLPERRGLAGTQPELFGLFDTAGDGTWARRVLTDDMGSELLPSPNYAADQTVYCGRKVSSDGGLTWRPLARGPSGQPPYVVSVGPITGTLPVVYALDAPYRSPTGGSGLLLSEDGGAHWQTTEAASEGIVDVVASPGFPDDQTALLVTAGGFVYRAEDGRTFASQSRIPSFDPVERNVYDLALSPDFAHDGTAMVAVEDPLATKRANVYVSNSRGASWQSRTSGLDQNARPRALWLSPGFVTDRLVFLGAERRDFDPAVPAILASDSAGAEWYPELYLGPSVVRDFTRANVGPQGKLYAAAGAAGVYSRDLADPVGPVVVTPQTTATRTPSATCTQTPFGDTPTLSPTPTASATGGEESPTWTPSATETPGGTPWPSASSTGSPSATGTERPGNTPSATASQVTTTPGDTRRRLFLPAATKRG